MSPNPEFSPTTSMRDNHERLKAAILSNYESRRGIAKASIDIVVLASSSLGIFYLEASLPNAHPEDIDISVGKISMLTKVLQHARGGSWKSAILYCQEEARAGLNEAAFRSNEFEDETNAQTREREAILWTNLGMSLQTDSSLI